MLFIISLLFVNVVSSSPADLLKESAAFLASMSEADPNVVKEMITLIGDLERENQDDAQKAEDAAIKSRGVAELRAQQHADRTAQMNAAKKAFVDATGLKNELTTLEKTQRATLEQANQVLANAQMVADSKARKLQSVRVRVADEKKAFKQVLELLDEVIVPESLVTLNRNLLSLDTILDSADPDAVAAVKKQVVALAEAADKELATAIAINNQAQNVLKSAQADQEEAQKRHTATSGRLTEAIEDLAKKTIAKDNAITAEAEARKVMDSTERKAVADRKFANSEAARVAEEAKALAEAKRLLQTLL